MSAYQLNIPVVMAAAMVTVFFAAWIQNRNIWEPVNLYFVAIYAVISVINQIFSSIAYVAATTTFTMASVFHGEGNNKALRVLFSIFTKYALIIGGVVMLAAGLCDSSM